MKKALFGLFAVMMLAACAMAQEEVTIPENNKFMPSLSLAIDYSTRYMSKGKIINPEDMFFTDVYVECLGFYFDLWGAFDANDYNKGKEKGDGVGGVKHTFEEIDYGFGYAYTFENLDVINSLGIDVGVTYWDYPKRLGWQCVNEQQYEWHLDLSTGLLLNPGMTFYGDFETEKFYGKLYANYEYALADNLTLDNKVELFWGNSKYNANDYSVKHNGVRSSKEHTYKETLSTFVWTITLSHTINDHFSWGPYAKLAWALDHDIRDAWKEHGSANSKSGVNNLFGVSVSASF